MRANGLFLFVSLMLAVGSFAAAEGWNAPTASNAFSLAADSQLRWSSFSSLGLESTYTLAGIVDVGAFGRVSDDELFVSDSQTTALGASFAAYPIKQIDGSSVTVMVDARLFYGFVDDPFLESRFLEQVETGFEIGTAVGRDVDLTSSFFLRVGVRALLKSTLTTTALSFAFDEEGGTSPTVDGLDPELYPLTERESSVGAGTLLGVGMRVGRRSTFLLASTIMYDSNLDLIVRPRLGVTVLSGPLSGVR